MIAFANVAIFARRHMVRRVRPSRCVAKHAVCQPKLLRLVVHHSRQTALRSRQSPRPAPRRHRCPLWDNHAADQVLDLDRSAELDEHLAALDAPRLLADRQHLVQPAARPTSASKDDIGCHQLGHRRWRHFHIGCLSSSTAPVAKSVMNAHCATDIHGPHRRLRRRPIGGGRNPHHLPRPRAGGGLRCLLSRGRRLGHLVHCLSRPGQAAWAASSAAPESRISRRFSISGALSR